MEDRSKYAQNLLRLVREYIQVFRVRLGAAANVLLQRDLAMQRLSVREYQVLRLLAAGRSNQEIALELCISIPTVKYHNSQIFEKLGVGNRLKAVKKAWETGIRSNSF